MGVPSRFAVEYPERVLQLISVLEPYARRRELLGSFGLLAAAAVLTIPYERMQSRHFLHKSETDGDLVVAIKRLKKVAFSAAPFWQGGVPGAWWQSRIVNAVDRVDGWRDEDGRHPLAADATTKLDDRKQTADGVIRVLRNALAHGNIIYLDKDFHEAPGQEMAYMAFLSRYEELAGQRESVETYRLVVTTDEEFLRFVKLWATWVRKLDDKGLVAEAA